MNSELKARSLKELSAAYLAKELRVNPEYQRGLQWGLAQKQGLIDSLKILQLIAFIEAEIDRTIPETDVVMDNFRSVRTMAARFGART